MGEHKILITQRQIDDRVRQLGAQISRDYSNTQLLLVSVLKGAFIFAADLARVVDLPLTIEFIQASSYGNKTTSSGDVKLLFGSNIKVDGIHILLIEDICDTGHTLRRLSEHFKGLGAASVKTVALVNKQSRREVEFTCDYVGFEVEDLFLVGYGMDYNEQYRNLDNICVLESCAVLK